MNDMKGIISMVCLSVITVSGAWSVNSEASTYRIKGENEFKEHCASCHADGSNIIQADKTLFRKDREKHGVKSVADIVSLMRKPGEGMTTFDKKTVSDKKAKAIADYIIKTFK